MPSEVLQENHYYPFGLAQEYGWMNNNAGDDSKYLYNGKELNEDFGLGLYDYGARWYDGAIGRWWGVDALAEKYVSMSPFVYVVNNPLKYIDPDGKEIWISVGNGERVQYKNGRLYKDGEVYHAEKGSFAYNTQMALNHIAVNGGEVGFDLIYSLSSDKHTDAFIEETKEENGETEKVGPSFTNTLFNPKQGIINEKGEIGSPALVLAHELGHAYFNLSNERSHSGKVPDKRYNNTAEKVTVLGVETSISMSFEKNGYGRFSRDHHTGDFVEVKGNPTSNMAKDPSSANAKMKAVRKDVELLNRRSK